ncbi:MAG: MFS transporter [Acidobacteria bacterium]|nr:MFS transporter [Acidobacteriota bacterium]
MPDDPRRAVSIRALTAACYAGAFIFGTAFATLGAILPVLRQTVDLSVAQAARLFFFLNLGSLAATMITGLLVDRIGYKATLIVSPFLVAASFSLLGAAGSNPTLILCSCLMGLGAGALNNATNALVADLNPHRRAAALNHLGTVFSLGAISVPLLVGARSPVSDLRALLLIPAAVAAAVGAAVPLLAFPAAKRGHRVPLRQQLPILTHPILLLMGLLLFFQGGNEASSAAWISSFFTAVRQFGDRQAAWILALFWICFTLARLLAGIVLRKIPEIRFVYCSGFGVTAAWLLLLYSQTAALEVLATGCLGFCLGGIFQTCLSIMGNLFPEDTGTVFGVLLTLAISGGAIVPLAVGQIAEVRGMVSGMSLLPFCSVAVCILARRISRAALFATKGE